MYLLTFAAHPQLHCLVLHSFRCLLSCIQIVNLDLSCLFSHIRVVFSMIYVLEKTFSHIYVLTYFYQSYPSLVDLESTQANTQVSFHGTAQRDSQLLLLG